MSGIPLIQKSKNIKQIIFNFVVISVISTLLVTLMSSCTKEDYDPIVKESRSLISEVMAKEKIPGLAAALIDENKVIWTEGFGYTDLDKKIPVTPETIFSIQSISKTITATAEMIAVQDGMIDLDKPISNYLPSFTVNSQFEEKSQDKITTKQLLSHFAGFSMEAPVGNNTYPESPSFEAHIKSISDTWLRYPVGQRYCYSNLGVDLAGYILQVKSGKSFPDYVKEKLLDPIGMKSSTFDIDVIRKSQNRAVGHSKYCTSVPLEIPMIPSGGFYSNVSDLSKFIQFHLNKGINNGKQILNPELLDEMYTIPYPGEYQYEGYALGIVKKWDDKYNVFYYTHGGGGFGFLSNIVWYPDYGVGLVILTNSDDNSIQNQLTNQIMGLLLKHKQPTNNMPKSKGSAIDTSQPVDLSDLKKFTGVYIGRSQQLSVSVDTITTFTFDNSDSHQGRFITPDICQYDQKWFKFMPPGKAPAYIVRTYDGINWDYNDGPNDLPGPAKKEWEKFTGTYVVNYWGQMTAKIDIELKNGYLYGIDPTGYQYKLLEYEPGLFFTCTGESVDFRGETTMFFNIPVQKTN